MISWPRSATQLDPLLSTEANRPVDSLLTNNAFTLGTAPKSHDASSLKEAAQLFEGYFLDQLVKAMRGTVPESGFLPKGMGEKIFTEELDQKYVQNWVDQGGIGLADLIVEQMRRAEAPPQPLNTKLKEEVP